MKLLESITLKFHHGEVNHGEVHHVSCPQLLFLHLSWTQPGRHSTCHRTAAVLVESLMTWAGQFQWSVLSLPLMWPTRSTCRVDHFVLFPGWGTCLVFHLSLAVSPQSPLLIPQPLNVGEPQDSHYVFLFFTIYSLPLCSSYSVLGTLLLSVRNASCQTCLIKICLLTRSPGDLFAH